MMTDMIGMDPINNSESAWVIDVLGPELARLRNNNSKLGAGWDPIQDNAVRILGECPDPSQTTGNSKGIVIGKIQSGKTLSYTTLIALGMDNKYKITVVLGGTKKTLVSQNYDRLEKDLNANSRPELVAIKNPSLKFNYDMIEGVLQYGGHILLVALKNRARINDVRKILSRPELKKYPTLIIDDEGDEASLNTQFRDEGRSATYDSIVRLRESLDTWAYIAYTATPQAPLLISNIDELSPNFGVLIQPGQDYCGGSTFFGPDARNYLREIPTDESGEGDNAPEGIPAGLERAIALYFAGGAIGHLRQPEIKPETKYSMLIHSSGRKDDHQRLYDSVCLLTNYWKEQLRLKPSDPNYESVLRLFRSAYDDLCTTVSTPPSWEKVVERLLPELLLNQIWVVNSSAVGRDPITEKFSMMNNILIGGNMLGRGVTVPNLTVTYITRRAINETNADTMEQRARWFGYKHAYIDICRVFLTRQLVDNYTELVRHEEDFWASLTRNSRQNGLNIRDWPRIMRLDTLTGIQPTRQNVASYRPFHSRGWDTQTKVNLDATIVSQNIAVIDKFFSERKDRLQEYKVGSTAHSIIENCPTEELVNELLVKINSLGTNWDNIYNCEYLMRLFLDHRLPTVDVVQIIKGDLRDRSWVTQNGVAKPNYVSIMQGSAVNYPGDKEIHRNRPQLQVHRLRIKETGQMTLALALHIPQDNRFDMQYIVRSELEQ